MSHETIQPPGWLPPRGYANGVVTTGRLLHIGGQIGWDPTTGDFASLDLVDQFSTTLDNILAIVRTAGGAPEDVVRMTVFVTDMDAYRRGGKRLGAIWRERFGRHYPAMALLGISELVEPRARIEIEAVAVLPEATP